MGYSVTVYLSDAAGNPSLVAKDAAGADLTWTNSMTSSAASAGLTVPFTSLAAGRCPRRRKAQAMSGGASAGTLVPFAWTPAKGLYRD